jgi:hypothetical protein
MGLDSGWVPFALPALQIWREPQWESINPLMSGSIDQQEQIFAQRKRRNRNSQLVLKKTSLPTGYEADKVGIRSSRP